MAEEQTESGDLLNASERAELNGLVNSPDGPSRRRRDLLHRAMGVSCDDLWDHATGDRIDPGDAGCPVCTSSALDGCANYSPPVTCLTAPSSETGRCDRCQKEARDA